MSACSATATPRSRAAARSRSSTRCCVTHEAVSKSRQAAARAARTARTVYVTGCASRLEDAFPNAPGNVVVTERTGDEAAAFVARDVGALGCVDAEHRLDRWRAFVRIQDGCSFSCAFCVIPHVRGATRSRTAAAVLAEIRRRVDQGHREIVLTGVNLGCFRDRAAGYTPRAPRPRGRRGRPGSSGSGSRRSR